MYSFSKRFCCDYMLLRLACSVKTTSSVPHREIIFIIRPKFLNTDSQFYGLSTIY